MRRRKVASGGSARGTRWSVELMLSAATSNCGAMTKAKVCAPTQKREGIGARSATDARARSTSERRRCRGCSRRVKRARGRGARQARGDPEGILVCRKTLLWRARRLAGEHEGCAAALRPTRRPRLAKLRRGGARRDGQVGADGREQVLVLIYLEEQRTADAARRVRLEGWRGSTSSGCWATGEREARRLEGQAQRHGRRST